MYQFACVLLRACRLCAVYLSRVPLYHWKGHNLFMCTCPLLVCICISTFWSYKFKKMVNKRREVSMKSWNQWKLKAIFGYWSPGGKLHRNLVKRKFLTRLVSMVIVWNMPNPLFMGLHVECTCTFQHTDQINDIAVLLLFCCFLLFFLSVCVLWFF